MRKEIDKATLKALERLASVLPDLVWVVDREGIFKLTGGRPSPLLVGPREAVGRTVEEVLPAEICGQARSAVEAVLDTGGVRSFEYSLADSEGSRQFDAVFSRLDDRHVVCVSRDITDRKLAEEQRQTHQERLQRFMDSATDSFHLLDADLRVIDINERAMDRIRNTPVGVTDKSQVIGRDLLDIYPFLRGEAGEDRFKGVLATGEPTRIESAVEHPSRGTIHIVAKVFPVGKDLGVIATDISDRKRAEEERIDLERQMLHTQKLESLGVLAGGIAHDFNNILVSILGYADMGLAESAPNTPAEDYFSEIVNGARRAAELANQMLAYSGRGHFELKLVDLNELVTEMTKLLQVSISKRASLRCNLEDRLPAIEVDPTQVHQVVMNLVTNASDAIGDSDGAISITTGVTRIGDDGRREDGSVAELAPGEYVFLSVADTGCGMDEDTLGRLFDPFFTTKFAGRGLGMAAAQGIVRGHKGAIYVRSRPDEGTVVQVLFPVVSQEVEHSGVSVDRSVGEESWTGEGTILVVDDDETVRSVGQQMLEKLGFAVLTATDGRKALDVFRDHAEEFSCVILDMTMPHMDGQECCRELQAIREDVPIILSSGFSESEIRQRLSGTGVVGFIAKPFRLETIRRMLREVLGG